jgi:hypothetical protein
MRLDDVARLAAWPDSRSRPLAAEEKPEFDTGTGSASPSDGQMLVRA